jgi:hypothetical protein
MKLTAVCLLALLGCQPQADTSYLGEPLVTLQGQVKSTGSLAALEAAMLWQRGDPPSTIDEELATRAPVQTGFPASFTISLYQPPPVAAQHRLAPGLPIYARANAGAVPLGVALAAAPPLADSGNQTYGVDAGHWVVYLSEDAKPGSVMEWWLGASLPAGFHLLRATACQPPADASGCVADLQSRGLADATAASALCLAPYRLTLAPPGEELVLDLGTIGLPGDTGAACP